MRDAVANVPSSRSIALARVVAAMKTADFFVERLKAWGVKRIFGYSGDGINGVIGAIQRDGGDRLHPAAA